METSTIGRLLEFRGRSHWTDDLFINQLQEPARGTATTRDLLVVTVYLLNAKSGKVGPDGRYNMANREDVCQFLTDEFGVRKFGIATMISGTSHGAKYLLDLTEEQDSTIADLPIEAIKLAKGGGTRVDDPRQSIVTTANLPSWKDVGCP